MSVSNSDTFTQTRDQIIADALIALGVYRPGATIGTNDISVCSNWLNKITKSWDAQGIHMWTQVEGSLFLVSNQCKYTVTGTNVAGDNVVSTTLAAAASASTLTLTSTTGMTAADKIGIQLDNNTRQWTTISSVDSTTQVTIATPLTSAAASGNTVFSYTRDSSRILHITSAVCTDNTGVDRPVYIRSRDEYLAIPNKTTTSSSINQLFYTSTRSDGDIYVWPTPDNCSYRIKYNYTRALFDFSSSSDNADLPVEWLHCLTVALKADVAEIYGASEDKVKRLRADAEREFMEMTLNDVNSGSIRVVPNSRDDE